MKTQLRRSQNTQLFRYFQLMWPEPLYSNGSGYEIDTVMALGTRLDRYPSLAKCFNLIG